MSNSKEMLLSNAMCGKCMLIVALKINRGLGYGDLEAL